MLSGLYLKLKKGFGIFHIRGHFYITYLGVGGFQKSYVIFGGGMSKYLLFLTGVGGWSEKGLKHPYVI